jgi:hypothetical protein
MVEDCSIPQAASANSIMRSIRRSDCFKDTSALPGNRRRPRAGHQGAAGETERPLRSRCACTCWHGRNRAAHSQSAIDAQVRSTSISARGKARERPCLATPRSVKHQAGKASRQNWAFKPVRVHPTPGLTVVNWTPNIVRVLRSPCRSFPYFAFKR